MASISKDTLAGYILEELIAYLIRNTGYRLLVDASQDPLDLVNKSNGLNIIGRGALHQVDVLGELLWIPAFTFPLRLIIEAKCRKDRTGIDVVRGMMAALTDVNQNNFPSRANASDGPRRSKYTYVGAVFSASGFSGPASDLGLAHGISLVDLNTPEFKPLVDAARVSAAAIVEGAEDRGGDVETVRDVSREKLIRSTRVAIRAELGTDPGGQPQAYGKMDALLQSMAISSAVGAAEEVGELFVGMAAGPYMLLLKADKRERFLAYAAEHPTHDVSIRWSSKDGEGRTWQIAPTFAASSYRLSFRLPEEIGDWIFESERNARRAALSVKQTLFSSISIFRIDGNKDQLIRLNYDATAVPERPARERNNGA